MSEPPTHQPEAETAEQLVALAAQIDANDTQLLNLLDQRLKLERQLKELRRSAGLPAQDPQQEREWLAARQAKAKQLGLSPELITDILRRCPRESQQPSALHSPGVRPKLRIVVVGGAGQLGRRFVEAFDKAGYDVAVLERGDWAQAQHICSNAALVLVAVPIGNTTEVIQRLPTLPPDCILADLTSVKTAPLEAMLRAHSGPVIGFHPMFGPDVQSFAQEVTVVCTGRGSKAQLGWLLEQLELWGMQLHYIEAAQHDRLMGLIQAMRHATTYAYGLNLCREHPDLKQLLALSSPIYRLELIMVGRLFAQSPQLYFEIICSQEQHINLIRDYHRTLGQVIELLAAKDQKAFEQYFAEVRDFFGDLGEEFLHESRDLLAYSKARSC